MFERWMSSLLGRLLGAYVDANSFSLEGLSVGVWSGYVVLENMRLKTSLLDSLLLPIALQHGVLGRLEIRIPWSHLGTEPIVVVVDKVFVVVTPKYTWDVAAKEARAQAVKKARVAAAEMFRSNLLGGEDEEGAAGSAQQWLMERLINKIADSLQVHVREVHFRYEDTLSDTTTPFYFGMTLESVHVQSTQQQWALSVAGVRPAPEGEAGTDKLVKKVVQLHQLCFYWNVVQHGSSTFRSDLLAGLSHEEVDMAMHRLIARRHGHADCGVSEPELAPVTSPPPRLKHHYILAPVDAIVRVALSRDPSDVSLPKVQAHVEVAQVSLQLEDSQYRSALCVAASFAQYSAMEKYSELRPSVHVQGNARAWWKYVVAACLEEVRKAHPWPLRQIGERRRLRLEYEELWRNVSGLVGLDGSAEGGAQGPSTRVSPARARAHTDDKERGDSQSISGSSDAAVEPAAFTTPRTFARKKLRAKDLSRADQVRLEELEKVLSFEDIMMFRAMSERKALLKARAMEASSSKTESNQWGVGGWVSWAMRWKGGGYQEAGWLGRARGTSGHISDEEYERLFKAIDFDPQLAAEQHPPAAPTAASIRVQFSLQEGAVTLASTPTSSSTSFQQPLPFMETRCSGVAMTLAMNDDASVGSASVGVADFSVFEVQAAGAGAAAAGAATTHRSIVTRRPQGRGREGDGQHEELFLMALEIFPPGSECDTSLSLVVDQVEAVLSPTAAWIDTLSGFFASPEKLDYWRNLEWAAVSKFNSVKAQLEAKLAMVMSNRVLAEVNLDIKAPVVVIPVELLDGEGVEMLVIDLGRVQLTTESLADIRDVGAVREEIAAEKQQQRKALHRQEMSSIPMHDCLGGSEQSNLYDIYRLHVSQICMLMVQRHSPLGPNGSTSWQWDERETSPEDSSVGGDGEGGSLVNRFNIKMEIHTSVMPDDPTITRLKINGDLPELCLRLSQRLLQRMVKASAALTAAMDLQSHVPEVAALPGDGFGEAVVSQGQSQSTLASFLDFQKSLSNRFDHVRFSQEPDARSLRSGMGRSESQGSYYNPRAAERSSFERTSFERWSSHEEDDFYDAEAGSLDLSADASEVYQDAGYSRGAPSPSEADASVSQRLDLASSVRAASTSSPAGLSSSTRGEALSDALPLSLEVDVADELEEGSAASGSVAGSLESLCFEDAQGFVQEIEDALVTLEVERSELITRRRKLRQLAEQGDELTEVELSLQRCEAETKALHKNYMEMIQIVEEGTGDVDEESKEMEKEGLASGRGLSFEARGQEMLEVSESPVAQQNGAAEVWSPNREMIMASFTVPLIAVHLSGPSEGSAPPGEVVTLRMHGMGLRLHGRTHDARVSFTMQDINMEDCLRKRKHPEGRISSSGISSLTMATSRPTSSLWSNATELPGSRSSRVSFHQHLLAGADHPRGRSINSFQEWSPSPTGSGTELTEDVARNETEFVRVSVALNRPQQASGSPSGSPRSSVHPLDLVQENHRVSIRLHELEMRAEQETLLALLQITAAVLKDAPIKEKEDKKPAGSDEMDRSGPGAILAPVAGVGKTLFVSLEMKALYLCLDEGGDHVAATVMSSISSTLTAGGNDIKGAVGVGGFSVLNAVVSEDGEPWVQEVVGRRHDCNGHGSSSSNLFDLSMALATQKAQQLRLKVKVDGLRVTTSLPFVESLVDYVTAGPLLKHLASSSTQASEPSATEAELPGAFKLQLSVVSPLLVVPWDGGVGRGGGIWGTEESLELEVGSLIFLAGTERKAPPAPLDATDAGLGAARATRVAVEAGVACLTLKAMPEGSQLLDSIHLRVLAGGLFSTTADETAEPCVLLSPHSGLVTDDLITKLHSQLTKAALADFPTRPSLPEEDEGGEGSQALQVVVRLTDVAAHLSEENLLLLAGAGLSCAGSYARCMELVGNVSAVASAPNATTGKEGHKAAAAAAAAAVAATPPLTFPPANAELWLGSLSISLLTGSSGANHRQQQQQQQQQRRKGSRADLWGERLGRTRSFSLGKGISISSGSSHQDLASLKLQELMLTARSGRLDASSECCQSQCRLEMSVGSVSLSDARAVGEGCNTSNACILALGEQAEARAAAATAAGLVTVLLDAQHGCLALEGSLSSLRCKALPGPLAALRKYAESLGAKLAGLATRSDNSAEPQGAGDSTAQPMQELWEQALRLAESRPMGLRQMRASLSIQGMELWLPEKPEAAEDGSVTNVLVLSCSVSAQAVVQLEAIAQRASVVLASPEAEASGESKASGSDSDSDSDEEFSVICELLSAGLVLEGCELYVCKAQLSEGGGSSSLPHSSSWSAVASPFSLFEARSPPTPTPGRNTPSRHPSITLKGQADSSGSNKLYHWVQPFTCLCGLTVNCEGGEAPSIRGGGAPLVRAQLQLSLGPAQVQMFVDYRLPLAVLENTIMPLLGQGATSRRSSKLEGSETPSKALIGRLRSDSPSTATATSTSMRRGSVFVTHKESFCSVPSVQADAMQLDLGSLLYAVGLEVELKAEGVRLTVVNNLCSQSTPVASVECSLTGGMEFGNEHGATCELKLSAMATYYNLRLVMWEPLMEPWQANLTASIPPGALAVFLGCQGDGASNSSSSFDLTAPPVSVTVTAEETLCLNVTEALLESVAGVALAQTALEKPNRLGDGGLTAALHWVANETGVALLYRLGQQDQQELAAGDMQPLVVRHSHSSHPMWDGSEPIASAGEAAQNSIELEVQEEGKGTWRSAQALRVDKVASHPHCLMRLAGERRTRHREPSSQVWVVSQLQCKSGIKVLRVRSRLQLRNHLSESALFIALRAEAPGSSRGTLPAAATSWEIMIAPRECCAVPITLVDDVLAGVLLVRLLPVGLEVSEASAAAGTAAEIQLPSLTTLEDRACSQTLSFPGCSSHPQSFCGVSVGMEDCEDPSGSSGVSRKPEACIVALVTFHPPLLLTNLLAAPLELRVTASSEAVGVSWEGELEPGAALQWMQCSPERDLLLSVRTRGFSSWSRPMVLEGKGSTEAVEAEVVDEVIRLRQQGWTVQEGAAGAAEEAGKGPEQQLSVALNDASGGVLRLQLEMKMTRGLREVVLWVPYWLVNGLGLPLQVRHDPMAEGTGSGDGLAAGQVEKDDRGDGFCERGCPGLRDLMKPAATGLQSRIVGVGALQELPEQNDQDDLIKYHPLLLGFTHPSKHQGKVQLRVVGAQWSQLLSLDQAGSKTVLEVPGQLPIMSKLVGHGHQAFALGVAIKEAPGPYHRTRVIAVTPRYVIVNALGRAIEVKQALQGVDRGVVTVPCDGSAAFHWTEVRSGGVFGSLRWNERERDRRTRHMVLRVQEYGWEWSGQFAPDHLGELSLRLRNRHNHSVLFARVEVLARGASLALVVRGEPEGFAPYRVENNSLETLLLSQVEVGAVETLLPYHAFPYTWDEPLGNRALQVAVQLKDSPVARPVDTYRLDELEPRSSRQSPSENLRVSIVMDGPTRVLQFTDARLLPEPQPPLQSVLGKGLLEGGSKKHLPSLQAQISTLRMTLESLQVDNQLSGTVYPALLYPLQEALPQVSDSVSALAHRWQLAEVNSVGGNSSQCLEVTLQLQHSYTTVNYVRELSFFLAPMDVNLDGALVEELGGMHARLESVLGLEEGSLYSVGAGSEGASLVGGAGPSQVKLGLDTLMPGDLAPLHELGGGGAKLYLEQLFLAPLRLHFSYTGSSLADRSTNSLSSYLLRYTKAMANCENAPIHLPALAVDHRLTTPGELLQLLGGFYTERLLRHAFLIVGSSSWLFNAVGLWQNTVGLWQTMGTRDGQATAGVVTKASGVIRGVLYWFTDLVSRAVETASDVMLATGAVDLALVGPGAGARRPTNPVNGTLLGLAGAVMDPVAGLRTRNVVWLALGVAKGTGGLVIRPAYGMLMLSASVTRVLSEVVDPRLNKDQKLRMRRRRPPRYFRSSREAISLYSAEQDQGEEILARVEGGRLRSDGYIWHAVLQATVLLVTGRRLVLLKDGGEYAPSEVVWSVPFEDLVLIEADKKGGTSITLFCLGAGGLHLVTKYLACKDRSQAAQLMRVMLGQCPELSTPYTKQLVAKGT